VITAIIGSNDRFLRYSFLISILVALDFVPPSMRPDQAHQHPSRENAQRESLLAVQDSSARSAFSSGEREKSRGRSGPRARGVLAVCRFYPDGCTPSAGTRESKLRSDIAAGT